MYLYEYYSWHTFILPLKSSGDGENKIYLRKTQLWPKWLNSGSVLSIATFGEQAAIVKTSVEKGAPPASDGREVKGVAAFPMCWWLAGCFFVIPCLQRATCPRLPLTLLVDLVLSAACCFSAKTVGIFSVAICICCSLMRTPCAFPQHSSFIPEVRDSVG